MSSGPIRPLKLATRGSALALAQARMADAALGGGHELVEVRTSGDVRRAVDDKREWVAELEDALLEGRADVAVHSAKDVPVELADGCVIAGVLERADPRDALVGAPSLAALAPGAVVGTASLRRRAAVLAARPDLAVEDLRGNVDTRLRKVEAGVVDAAVLAFAGLARLGLDARATPLDAVVPAAGQGVIALECRIDDEAARRACALATPADAWAALRCERAVVAGLGADCRSAVGAHFDGRAVRTWVGAADGSTWIADELHASAADDPESLGTLAAQRLLAAGAAPLLAART